jgi:hypothetical protein
VRPRILSDEKVAHIRDVFAKARTARQRWRDDMAQLPRPEQLAVDCECSVALIRLIGSGHRYANEPDLLVDKHSTTSCR